MSEPGGDIKADLSSRGADEAEEGTSLRRDPFSALDRLKLDGPAAPAPGWAEDDTDLNTVSTSLKDDPTEEARPTLLVKRVSWVQGVNESKSAHIAISIPRHKFLKDKEYVVYVMELWRSGRSWSIRKRYSEFYNFHEDLIAEGLVEESRLPRIPPKRWFHWLRWTNRFDEKFTWQRRTQLQEYIRAIVKIDPLVEESRVLHKFLEINRSLAINGSSRDSQDDRNSFYYDITTLLEN